MGVQPQPNGLCGGAYGSLLLQLFAISNFKIYARVNYEGLCSSTENDAIANNRYNFESRK